MRSRYLVPLALVAFVAAVSASFLASSPARAAARPGPAGSGSAAPSTPPTTVSLATADVAAGNDLFQANCATCHTADASGSSRGPNLVGLGAATVDFWLSTGRMPLAYPTAQAIEKAPRFDNTETRDIVAYVTSLGAGGPGIPSLDLAAANVSSGAALFATNCAGCHGITGVGDALSNGLHAPSLYPATPTVIAEAMRTGPGNMPRFGPGQFSPQQINDLVAFVRTGIQRPDDKGGNGLGHVGPITEGFVAIFIGLGVIMLVAYWTAGRVEGSEPDPAKPEPAELGAVHE